MLTLILTVSAVCAIIGAAIVSWRFYRTMQRERAFREALTCGVISANALDAARKRGDMWMNRALDRLRELGYERGKSKAILAEARKWKARWEHQRNIVRAVEDTLIGAWIAPSGDIKQDLERLMGAAIDAHSHLESESKQQAIIREARRWKAIAKQQCARADYAEQAAYRWMEDALNVPEPLAARSTCTMIETL